MEEALKVFAVLFTLALGLLLSGPAQADAVGSILSVSGAQMTLPSPEGLYTSFVGDLPQALMALGATGGIQQSPPKTPPKDINLSINVNQEKATAARPWYFSPVWMAIGGLGLLLGIILIIMAARGGGSPTTVVRS